MKPLRRKRPPKRGEAGAEAYGEGVGVGFLSAERRRVNDELEEEGVEHDGDESSEEVGECAEDADGVSSSGLVLVSVLLVLFDRSSSAVVGDVGACGVSEKEEDAGMNAGSEDRHTPVPVTVICR